MIYDRHCFDPCDAASNRPALEAYLLGRLDFELAEHLQRHLHDQIAQRDDGQAALIICEHEPIITIGRGGSSAQVATDSGLVRTGRVPVRWVGRGGAAVVHCPGQLAVYPIVPLWWHGWTVGEYLGRLCTGLARALETVGIRVRVEKTDSSHDLFGRSGRVATLGVAVRRWVSWHGAFINVSPAMGLFRLIEPQFGETEPPKWGCLLAEQRRPIKISAVRSALVGALAEAFDCPRYHLHSGHPRLTRLEKAARRA